MSDRRELAIRGIPGSDGWPGRSAPKAARPTPKPCGRPHRAAADDSATASATPAAIDTEAVDLSVTADRDELVASATSLDADEVAATPTLAVQRDATALAAEPSPEADITARAASPTALTAPTVKAATSVPQATMTPALPATASAESVADAIAPSTASPADARATGATTPTAEVTSQPTMIITPATETRVSYPVADATVRRSETPVGFAETVSPTAAVTISGATTPALVHTAPAPTEAASGPTAGANRAKSNCAKRNSAKRRRRRDASSEDRAAISGIQRHRIGCGDGCADRNTHEPGD